MKKYIAAEYLGKRVEVYHPTFRLFGITWKYTLWSGRVIALVPSKPETVIVMNIESNSPQYMETTPVLCKNLRR